MAEMADTPVQFLALDNAQFRSWLKKKELGSLEQELSKDSDIKPSDLVNCIFVDGKNGVKEVIQDEVGGYFLKLSTINRLRVAFAESSNLVSIVSSPLFATAPKQRKLCSRKQTGVRWSR
jgi:hypothetical protein